MMAPLFKTGFFGREVGIVIAMLLGFGFGFFLEKAGFGSARKLSDVWYGRDFAVIQVMFSAVITTLVGVFGAYYAGWLDLDLMYLNPTYIWPQIAGGITFGLGFAIGGYCPGTVAVATITGKIDGLLFMLAFLFGVALFAEFYPLLEGFYKSGYEGRLFLSDALGLSHGLLAAIIVIFALGVFVFLHWLHPRINKGS
ncbi:MAG: YeeE/YedE family protein [Leptospiraceae bacterium]|nr:YeeE/YedE family protein [Leptospiraceae bacterium]